MAALCLSLLFAVGSAEARPFGPAEEAAWAEAEAYWGVYPALCTSITKEVVPRGTLDSPENGEVEVAERATIPAYPTACDVYMVEGLTEAELCGTLRHAYAHLLGYQHGDPSFQAATVEGCPGWVSTAVLRRRMEWSEWREARAVCRKLDRPKCWRNLKRSAQRIRSS